VALWVAVFTALVSIGVVSCTMVAYSGWDGAPSASSSDNN
jgi:hypothetical protein